MILFVSCLFCLLWTHSNALNTPLQVQQLAVQNHKLVPYFAKTYLRKYPYLTMDQKKEMVQEGYEGFMKACQKFDASRGFQLSTYSRFWIHRYMNEYIKKYYRDKYMFISLDSRPYLEESYEQSLRIIDEYDLEPWEKELLRQKFDHRRTFISISKEMNMSRCSLRRIYYNIYEKIRNQSKATLIK